MVADVIWVQGLVMVGRYLAEPWHTIHKACSDRAQKVWMELIFIYRDFGEHVAGELNMKLFWE